MEIAGINLSELLGKAESADKQPKQALGDFAAKLQDASKTGLSNQPLDVSGAIDMAGVLGQEQLTNAFSQVQSQLQGAVDGLNGLSSVFGMMGLSAVTENTQAAEQAASASENLASVANKLSAQQDKLDQSEEPDSLLTKTVDKLFEDGTVGWGDLVDTVNPIQHIPVVSSLYSQMSGDDQGYLSEVAGSLLLGTPWGMAATALDIGVDMATGKNAGEHLLGLFTEADN